MRLRDEKMPKTINLKEEAKRMNKYAKKLLESGKLFEMTAKACEIADRKSSLYMQEIDLKKCYSTNKYLDKVYQG